MQAKAASKISVEVQIPEGGSVELTVNDHETVNALKHQAMARLEVKPAAGVQYFLFLGGKRLADNVSLGEAGVRDQAVLVLASEPQVGAARL